MLLVAVAVGMSEGGVDAGEILVTLGLAAAFIGVVLLAGPESCRRHRSILTEPRFAETPFLPGMIVMLGLAALAAQSSVWRRSSVPSWPGMVVGESSERQALETETAPVAAFFTPFFFGFVGAQVDLAVFGQPQTIGAAAGDHRGRGGGQVQRRLPGGAARRSARAALVGWAMVPRGEVEIIVAGLALSAGAFGADLYLVVVGMVIITSPAGPAVDGAARAPRGTRRSPRSRPRRRG